jgi:4-carboxymuconolactone decarboxylase
MPTDAALDAQTLALVRLAAAIASGDEPAMRHLMAAVVEADVEVQWVEELLLQSILMAGYPRALVAFGLWRKVSGAVAPAEDPDAEYARLAQWEARGEETCTRVYGGNYAKLRRNVRDLHPAVDRWMLVEVPWTRGRPGWTCAAEVCGGTGRGAPRSGSCLHLRGALHSGASFDQVEAVLGVVNQLLGHEEWKEVKELWAVVRAGWTQED